MKMVAVAGAGILGSQIAFQTALHGCVVKLYDVDPARIDDLDSRIDDLASAYRRDTDTSDAELTAGAGRLSSTTSLADAVCDAELVIEAIPENIEIKRGFYRSVSKLVSPATILATNSSTLAPSMLADVVDRPERFLALHFANQIWTRNIAEVMGHPGTDPRVFQDMLSFARQIGMVPVALYKEKPGYIVNSLLVPLLESAVALAADGVADPHTIDRTWMIATGAPRGPFAILDVIGMRTSYQLTLAKAAQGDPAAAKIAAWIKAAFIDTNKLGVETGEGFYTYPAPRYCDPDFLTG